MATYGTLKANALTLLESTGATDVGAVIEIALHEAMNYIASKVRLDDLIESASFTCSSDDDSIPLGVSGFAVSDLVTPVELYVGDSATDDGVRYVYRRYMEWRRLKTVPNAKRYGVWNDPDDLRPGYCFTIDSSDNVLLNPTANSGDVVTLFYEKAPAAYNASNEPELNAKYHGIVLAGALLWGKEFIKEPETIINPYTLFAQLDPQIQEMELHLKALGSSTPVMRISSRYK